MKPIKSHIHGSPSVKNIIETLLKLRFCRINAMLPPACDQTPQHRLRANKTKSNTLTSKMGPVRTKKYSNVERLSSKKHFNLLSSISFAFSNCPSSISFAFVIPLKGKIMSAVTSSGRKWIMMVTDDTINGMHNSIICRIGTNGHNRIGPRNRI